MDEGDPEVFNRAKTILRWLAASIAVLALAVVVSVMAFALANFI